MSIDSEFEDLFPSFPRIDREWQARKARLMAMTVSERVAAMRAGQLSYRELAHWSSQRPDEVPRLCTGAGADGGGEFEWIAAFIPELAEAPTDAAQSSDLDPAAIERGQRIRTKPRAMSDEATSYSK